MGRVTGDDDGEGSCIGPPFADDDDNDDDDDDGAVVLL